MNPLILLGLLAAVETGDAEPAPVRPQVSFGAELAVASTYVFRGEPQYGRGTVPSFQPSAWLGLSPLGPGGLELQVWSAFAMADRPRVVREHGSASEVDLGLVYRAELAGDWLLLGAGFVYYVYPEAEPADGEKEFLVELGLGNLPVTPTVALWTEVHPGLGLHLEPRVLWEQQIGSLTVGADLSLGASFRRDASPSLDHTTLTVGLAQRAGPLSFGLRLSYTIRLGSGRGEFLDRSLLHGGVALRYER